MAETLTRARGRRRPPRAERLRGRRGRRRVAVRAARGGRQDARVLHPARPAPGPVRAGHHQQPRRRPDRPAAGQPARRRDARPGRPDRVPQRLLLRDRAGPTARHRGPFPVRVGHGHRERDARGDPGRGPHGDPPGRPGAGGRRPHRVPPEDGRRRRADRTPTRSRSRARSGCAAPSTGSSRTASRPARSSWPAR